jgi:hypothetical protein
MGTTPRVLMTATLLALGSTAVLLAQEQQPPAQKPFVTATTRYEGTAAVSVKAGAPVTLQVLRKNYGVIGPKAQITLPETGFMVVHLRVGRVTTILNGERRERTPGEFWTVPTGAQLSIEIIGESASLETFSVK